MAEARDAREEAPGPLAAKKESEASTAEQPPGRPSSQSSFIAARLLPIFFIVTALFFALGVIFIGTDPNDARVFIQRLLLKVFVPALAGAAFLTIIFTALQKTGLLPRAIDFLVVAFCLAVYLLQYVYPKLNLLDRYVAKPLASAGGWGGDAAAMVKAFSRAISDKDVPIMMWVCGVALSGVVVSTALRAAWRLLRALFCCGFGSAQERDEQGEQVGSKAR